MTRHIPTINAVDADSIQDYSYVQAEMDETFGQALARYMNELKIDIASLSASTGISKASIYYYTKNKRRISFNHIAAICIALRLHPLRSRYLFSLAHYQLSAQCKRDMTICNYICGVLSIRHLHLKHVILSCKQNISDRLPHYLPIKKSDGAM